MRLTFFLLYFLLFMRCRVQPGDLLHDPEIEKTARENRKVARLAKSPDPSARTQYTNLTPYELETVRTPVVVTMGEP